MIRPIVTNPAKLAIPSEKIHTPEVWEKIIRDLVDTATHWQNRPSGCLGLAANQIGELWRVIVVYHEGRYIPMINPSWEAVKRSPADCKREGCLSRPGIRSRVKRYKKIIITYTDEEESLIQRRLTGLTARVFQHEHNHLDGIFI